MLRYLNLVLIAFLILLSSCFTGIESTKKIGMSREDKKNTAPTQEEIYFSGILGTPLVEWEGGRKFIASDDKALLIFVPQGVSSATENSIKGKELSFIGIESKVNAAAQLTVVLVFGDGNSFYAYDTGKEFDEAMNNVTSADIPMLIDEQMVEEARKKLLGKQFWTRSSLWYDENGERIGGKKYVPVTITEVEPGNMIFPLRLRISDGSGGTAYMFMNFGNSDTESRAFHNLFFLTDIRKNYPAVEEETWNFISAGKVKYGMTKEECKLALGNPTDVNSGHDYSQTLDIWNYEDGTVLWFEDGRLTRFRQ